MAHYPNPFIRTTEAISRQAIPGGVPKPPTPIAMFYNTGRHLYFRQSLPRWFDSGEVPFQHVRFREFKLGNMIDNGVYLHHLGHEFDHFGGTARAYVHERHAWELRFWHCRPVYLIDVGDAVQLHVQRRPVKLPVNLFPLG